jgi:hypothetical protein
VAYHVANIEATLFFPVCVKGLKDRPNNRKLVFFFRRDDLVDVSETSIASFAVIGVRISISGPLVSLFVFVLNRTEILNCHLLEVFYRLVTNDTQAHKV